MINKGYREAAIETYGEACEICGHRSVEVHHIDYQEQWAMEARLRKAKTSELGRLIDQAKKLGYDHWDGKQLSKNDSTLNLSCLCGNCHSFVHKIDAGKKLLQAIPQRREQDDPDQV